MYLGYQYVRYLEYASVKNPNGILEEILFMIVDIFLYAGLLYIIEQKTIIRFIYSKRYHAGDKDEDEDEDENMLASITNDFVPKDVQDEREKVDAVVETMKSKSWNYTKKNNILITLSNTIFEIPTIFCNGIS